MGFVALKPASNSVNTSNKCLSDYVRVRVMGLGDWVHHDVIPFVPNGHFKIKEVQNLVSRHYGRVIS